MQITAKVNNVNVAPRKVRLVSESIKKLSPTDAVKTLSLIKKRGSYALLKTLQNAMASAKYRNLKESELIIKKIDVLEGRSLKRFRASTRGRVHPYKKRTTHIKIILTDDKSQMPNGKSQIKEEENGTKS